MKTASGPGFLSRLWKRRIQGDIQRRNDNISKQFPDAGWKNLPQELVDEILRYLLDDLPSLKACSLTCKHLFGLTRPLIHQRLVCPGSRPDHLKPKVSLFGRHKKDPGAFERLIDADRSGVLHYTRHLIFKPKRYGPDPYFKPNDLQEYLPHLRSVSNLHTLTIQSFYIPRFIPVFNEYFGTSTNTLRRLDMRGSFATGRQLLYILCQFPLLEDLTIVYPYWEPPTWEPPTWNPPPMITQIPPLRGKLVLVGEGSRELFEGLTAFPVKLNFRSLELFRCMGAAHVVLAACARTATSVSYFWHRQDDQTVALDLGQNVVLERFQLNIDLDCLPAVLEWVWRMLRTITSPVLNEFVIRGTYGSVLRKPRTTTGWDAVDALLSVMAERNPDFRVVFRVVPPQPPGDAQPTYVRWLTTSYLPVASSKGLVKFEHVSGVENRSWELDYLYHE